MIYDRIEFQAKPFEYKLHFTTRITLVRGDSATGKTYLYQLLEDVKQLDAYHNIKLFNYKSDDFHTSLWACRGKFIVIDNGDAILEEEDKKFINFEKTNEQRKQPGYIGRCQSSDSRESRYLLSGI